MNQWCQIESPQLTKFPRDYIRCVLNENTFRTVIALLPPYQRVFDILRIQKTKTTTIRRMARKIWWLFTFAGLIREQQRLSLISNFFLWMFLSYQPFCCCLAHQFVLNFAIAAHNTFPQLTADSARFKSCITFNDYRLFVPRAIVSSFV